MVVRDGGVVRGVTLDIGRTMEVSVSEEVARCWIPQSMDEVVDRVFIRSTWQIADHTVLPVMSRGRGERYDVFLSGMPSM